MWGSRHRSAPFLGRTEVSGVGLIERQSPMEEASGLF